MSETTERSAPPRRRWRLAAAVATVVGLLCGALLLRDEEGPAPTTDAPDGLYTGDGELPPDRWRSLPEAPLSPRARPTMLWTGTEVIVFGGDGVSPSASDGAVYDPRRRTWREIDPPPTPEGFSPTPEATTGDRLVVIYGQGSGMCDPARDVEGSPGAIYDLAGARWDPLPPAPAPLDCAVSGAWLDRELHLWFWGASGWAGLAYDPGTSTWREVTRVPFDDYDLVPVDDGQVVAFDVPSSLSSPGAGRRAAVFDVATSTWTSGVVDDGPPRSVPQPVGDEGGSALAGAVMLTEPGSQTPTALRSWIWQRTAGTSVGAVTRTIPAPPDGGATSKVLTWCDGRLVSWGGRIVTGMDSSVLAPPDGWVHDPSAASSTWDPIPDGPLSARMMPGSVCGDGVLYVWGGTTATGYADAYLADGAEYRPPSTD